MEKEKANKLIRKLKKERYKAKIYEGYSGRGMFGRETFGVTTNKVFDSKFNRDNMGLDYIYY